MALHVFTYGSLIFAPVWQRVVRGRHAHRAARLHGFERRAVRGRTYPAIVARDGGSVDGMLHLDVDDGDLRRLDVFEGDEYERRTVVVRLLDGSACTVPAQAYAWRDPGELLAHDWDSAWFERHALDAFLQTYCPSSGTRRA